MWCKHETDISSKVESIELRANNPRLSEAVRHYGYAQAGPNETKCLVVLTASR